MVSILSGEAYYLLFNHLGATSRGRFLLLLITSATNSWFYYSSSLFLWCVMEGNLGSGICQAAWIRSMIVIGNCEDQGCNIFCPLVDMTKRGRRFDDLQHVETWCIA